MEHMLNALQELNVKFQPRDSDENPEMRKTKIGGYDKRKERFTGYVEIENFSWNGEESRGSFCVMRREKVCEANVVSCYAFAVQSYCLNGC
jgi:serine/threonine-protein kinase Chk1